MSTDEINRAIAEHLGWTQVRVIPPHPRRKSEGPTIVGNPPATSEDRSILVPDYCGSLDVMHKTEKALFDGSAELWTRYLEVELPDLARTTSVECSPARQRAEAALRTIGKWRSE